MKKITTTIMLLAALTFGFTSCQSDKQKENTGLEGETSTRDGHNEEDGHDHSEDSLYGNHEGHDHADGDSTHTDSHGHSH